MSAPTHDEAVAMFQQPPFFGQPVREGETPIQARLRETLLNVAKVAADTPRNRQRQLGLSEYAHPCARQIAMKIAHVEPVNVGGDSWASTLGTWGHEGLEATLRRMDPDGKSWLLGTKVLVGGMIPGTLDAFHIPTKTLVDFKFCGPDTIKTYQRKGPPGEYVGQAHGYGAGLVEMGVEVEHVALAFYPRAASLADFWVWTEPFRPDLPARALDRIVAIHDLLDGLDLWDGRNPEQWAEVPMTPGRTCTFCPFWKPKSEDIRLGCPGKEPAQ